MAEGQLPQGWSLTAAGSVDASVTGGALRLGADGDDSGTSRLLTPVTAGSGENVDFIFEADLRFAGASQAGRWAGLMFGYQNAAPGGRPSPASAPPAAVWSWPSGAAAGTWYPRAALRRTLTPIRVYTFRTECARGVVRPVHQRRSNPDHPLQRSLRRPLWLLRPRRRAVHRQRVPSGHPGHPGPGQLSG